MAWSRGPRQPKEARIRRTRVGIERHIRLESDGSYLIRSISGRVFRTDAATKDRLLAYHFALETGGRNAMFLVIVGMIVLPWAIPWLLLGFVTVLFAVIIGGPFVVLRHAQRVAPEIWSSSLAADRDLAPVRRYVGYLLVWMVLAMITVVGGWQLLNEPGAPQRRLVIFVLAVLIWSLFALFYLGRRRIAAMEEASKIHG